MAAANVFTKVSVELKPNPARTIIRPYSSGCRAAFDRDRTRAQGVNFGARLRKRPILLPYATSDECSAFPTGSVDDLLSVMEWYGC